jgi:hypothetical protein
LPPPGGVPVAGAPPPLPPQADSSNAMTAKELLADRLFIRLTRIE